MKFSKAEWAVIMVGAILVFVGLTPTRLDITQTPQLLVNPSVAGSAAPWTQMTSSGITSTLVWDTVGHYGSNSLYTGITANPSLPQYLGVGWQYEFDLTAQSTFQTGHTYCFRCWTETSGCGEFIAILFWDNNWNLLSNEAQIVTVNPGTSWSESPWVNATVQGDDRYMAFEVGVRLQDMCPGVQSSWARATDFECYDVNAPIPSPSTSPSPSPANTVTFSWSVSGDGALDIGAIPISTPQSWVVNANGNGAVGTVPVGCSMEVYHVYNTTLNWSFDHFVLDGVSTTQNPLIVPMNSNHVLLAVFTYTVGTNQNPSTPPPSPSPQPSQSPNPNVSPTPAPTGTGTVQQSSNTSVPSQPDLVGLGFICIGGVVLVSAVSKKGKRQGE